MKKKKNKYLHFLKSLEQTDIVAGDIRKVVDEEVNGQGDRMYRFLFRIEGRYELARGEIGGIDEGVVFEIVNVFE